MSGFEIILQSFWISKEGAKISKFQIWLDNFVQSTKKIAQDYCLIRRSRYITFEAKLLCGFEIVKKNPEFHTTGWYCQNYEFCFHDFSQSTSKILQNILKELLSYDMKQACKFWKQTDIWFWNHSRKYLSFRQKNGRVKISSFFFNILFEVPVDIPTKVA